MKMTVGKKIVISFSIILILLISIGGTTFFVLDKLAEETEDIVLDAIPLGVAASGLLTDLVNQETGVRGYLATGDESFLEPYHAGQAGVKNNLETISKYLGKHPIMAQLIDEAIPKIEAIESYFDSQIKLVESGQIEEARAKAGDGKELFDSYRATNDKIMIDIDKLTNDAFNASKDMQKTATIIIVIVIGIAFAITGVITYLLVKGISKPIKLASEAMVKVADGDLTVNSIATRSKDEIGIMIETFNKMIKNLKGLVKTVGENSEQIASMSEELSSSADQNMTAISQVTNNIEEMAKGAVVQTSKVDNSKMIMGNLSTRIQEVTTNAKIVANSSVEAGDSADEGYKQIKQAISQMSTINVVVSNSADIVLELNEKISQIGSIVNVITNIANQTNLLALNAAIEAARAGEAGKGFAVVAEEVRKLAEQSNESTVSITNIIGGIQEDAKKAVGEMDNGAKAVKLGEEVVNKAGDSFKQVQSAIDNVVKQIQIVSTAIQEINNSSEAMVTNISEVQQIAESTSVSSQVAVSSIEEQSASMEEITSATNTLASMAEELQFVINKFKI